MSHQFKRGHMYVIFGDSKVSKLGLYFDILLRLNSMNLIIDGPKTKSLITRDVFDILNYIYEDEFNHDFVALECDIEGMDVKTILDAIPSNMIFILSVSNIKPIDRFLMTENNEFVETYMCATEKYYYETYIPYITPFNNDWMIDIFEDHLYKIEHDHGDLELIDVCKLGFNVTWLPGVQE